MPKIPDSRPGDQLTLQDAFIGLLTRICHANQHTFSWYTSKRGRTWISFKGFSPTIYSTAVELPARFSEKHTFDALEVLLAKHLPKLLQEEPPITSWLNERAAAEALPASREYCASLYARYLAGESLLPADYPDGPLTPPDDGDAD